MTMAAVRSVDSKSEEKFIQEDLPKIHAALDRARAGKVPAKVTVEVSEGGGIISILLESKKKFK